MLTKHFITAVSGEYSTIYFMTKLKKKSWNWCFYFTLNHFYMESTIRLYGYWRTCIILVDLTNSFSTKTKLERYAWFFGSKSLQDESPCIFLIGLSMLRGEITFPFHLNSLSNAPFYFFSTNEVSFSFSYAQVIFLVTFLSGFNINEAKNKRYQLKAIFKFKGVLIFLLLL